MYSSFPYVSSFLSWKTPGISKSLSSMDPVKGICDEPFFQFFADDYVNSVTLGHILELLTFCIEHHTYHIKNYVINKDLLRRVLVLMKSRHKFLVLSKFTFLLKSWYSFSLRDFCEILHSGWKLWQGMKQESHPLISTPQLPTQPMKGWPQVWSLCPLLSSNSCVHLFASHVNQNRGSVVRWS